MAIPFGCTLTPHATNMFDEALSGREDFECDSGTGKESSGSGCGIAPLQSVPFAALVLLRGFTSVNREPKVMAGSVRSVKPGRWRTWSLQ